MAEAARVFVGDKMRGWLRLHPDGSAKWSIRVQPQTQPFTAKLGEPLRFATRTVRKNQNWLKFPVGGINQDDAKAYADWLRLTGRVPGARLCTEQEWERAAKGADEREFPHGESLSAEDANYDETYGKDPGAMGPDVVGSHPASQSPFTVLDMIGNHFEMTLSSLVPDEVLGRGCSYFFDALTCHIANRNVFPAEMRGNDVTLRICGSWPPNR